MPQVSIVTPVYNGQQYLDDCIISVLRQTWPAWEYVIVDNQSTDRTYQIASRFAGLDPRVRVCRTPEHLPIISNWNYALRQISTTSKYCKVVHADDWLEPDCLKEMVQLAEKHPEAEIVGACRFIDQTVAGQGLNPEQAVFEGRDICRDTLMGRHFVFGSPSSIMVPAKLMRQEQPFYDEKFFHADTEACFRLLRHGKLGFIHRPLTGTRRHDHSETARQGQFRDRLLAERLLILRKYGPDIFAENEYQDALRYRLRRYYQYLAANFPHADTAAFMRYHRQAFREAECRFSWPSFTAAVLQHGMTATWRRIGGGKIADNPAFHDQ